ncbi:Kinase phosphorylation protein family protein [Cryptosporidium meleagridis]|uniref:Kinase phosphorylation protein family protein n=1 Tax=Cryptosporidium meleagridis TaxID=93969 RepID=A0A2P4Z0G2_9CRYT|nr:Kinase phosphorylation protein family protein [Cryptosporidium meleagridis]
MDLSDSFDIAKQSGVRGGAEQFNWDSLRSIPRKEREHYLGHSLHYNSSRGRGRFSRNDWFSKVHKSKPEKCTSSEFQNERERIINKEREIMNRLLGIPDNSESSEYIKNEVSESDKNAGTHIQESQEMRIINNVGRGSKGGIQVNKNQIFNEQRRAKRRSFSRSLSP